MRQLTIIMAAVCLGLPAPAAAEVVSSDERGFAVTGSADVAESPGEVWEALLQPARYWNGSHSWSADAGNLAIEPRAGGCFCETIPGGGSAEHMRVVNIVPENRLTMRGALGPLQSEALAGVLTITLEAQDGGTKLSWDYVVGGYARFQLADLAPAVDGVVAEQMTRLAALFD